MGTFIVIAVIWYVVGFWSHVFWIRNKYDYKTDDILTSMFSGFIGPFAFWIGWTVYGDSGSNGPKTLFRKRSD